MKRIKIIYTMTAPVSHIGQVSSIESYFNTITTAYGEIPVITGNTVRGILRDCGAKKLLDTYNKAVEKEAFNVLFSGGTLSGSTKNDVGRAKEVRSHFPLLSLLGGGLGTMIMAGNLLSGFLYPICTETEQITKIKSKTSWHDLIDEIEFTRTDDTKKDKNLKYIKDVGAESVGKAATQMRISVQYMAVGTKFCQELLLLDTSTEMEEAALYSCLHEWFKCHTIGGMQSKGFGFFDAESEHISVIDGNIEVSDYAKSLIEKYEDFLATENFDETVNLLISKKAKKVKNDKQS